MSEEDEIELLSGNSIDQLPSIDINNISSESLVMLSQPDKYICSAYNSTAMKLSDFLDVLEKSALSIKGLGTASQCDSSVFALVDHAHNGLYNKVDIVPLDVKAEEDDDFELTYKKYAPGYRYPFLVDDTSATIGYSSIDGTLRLLSCNQITQQVFIDKKYVMPAVGKTKLAFYSSEPGWNDIGFRGWVLADGSSYPLSAFQLSDQLKDVYGDYEDDSIFTVPSLSSFIKLNGSLDADTQGEAMYHVDGMTQLQKHAHYVSFRLEGKLGLTAEVKDSPDTDADDALHIGCGRALIPFKYTSPQSTITPQNCPYISSIINVQNNETDSAYCTRIKSWLSSSTHIWSQLSSNATNAASLSSALTGYFTAFTTDALRISCDGTMHIEGAEVGDVEISGETYPHHVAGMPYVFVGLRG